MCGVSGAIGADAERLAARMTSALVHRGPDDEGHLARNGVALGFRRLSIIDLDGGRQPISNETGDIHLVCNGEIYNSPALRRRLEAAGHRFRTQTDVEVILHLYEDHGEDCVRQLRGMFAFAVWDERDGSFLLARDHMGQKPLFFAEAAGHFLFASEIQALLASGVIRRELNTEGLWHYLSLRALPDELTLMRGVHKLPAASTLTRSPDGTLAVRRYWDPRFEPKLTLGETEAVDTLEERLRSTVRAHQLSDVTVGAFISGGIDSTTIAAMMARDSEQPVPAFCIGVEEASFNELPAARRVAESENMRFFGEQVRADVAALIPMMIHHLGEPADPYGMGIYLVSKLASRHVKVTLSGDGGDESFAGYDRYYGQKLADIYCLLPESIRQTVMQPLISAIPETFRYKSLAQKLTWVQSMSRFDGGTRYARALGILRFPPETKELLFTPEAMSRIEDRDSDARVMRYFNASNVTDLVDRMLYTDLMIRVADHNLVMSDRMSMACSLEVRSPFVDPDLVEFAARLPTRFKMKGRKLKYLLRRVAERYIPADVARLPKQGFGFPVGIWMRGELAPLVRARLGESGLAGTGVFEQSYIDNLVHEHMSGVTDHSYRLWLLLCLEFWFDIYVTGTPVATLQQDAQAAILGHA
jgi:asparagine synthase (glutamine-hydrolysing)